MRRCQSSRPILRPTMDRPPGDGPAHEAGGLGRRGPVPIACARMSSGGRCPRRDNCGENRLNVNFVTIVTSNTDRSLVLGTLCNRETTQMGCKVLAIGDAREALELSCDCPSHEGQGQAWFDCGTYEGSLTLALVTGWTQRRNDKAVWLCPQCARKSYGRPRSRVNGQVRLVEVFGV